MNVVPIIPIELRLAGLFLSGLVVGALVNLAAYRLAWHQRSISPWTMPLPNAPVRRGYDFLPVIGWLGLRREASLHGPGFWIRPLLVELTTGVLFAGLYWWEVAQGGLFPGWQVAQPLALAALATEDIALAVHLSFASHALLIALMMAVSLIDVDEKTIPDSLTLPGTLIALLAAVAYPWSLSPERVWQLPNGLALDFVRFNSPYPWPDLWKGAPNVMPLVVALACWWGWCLALMPRRWIMRRGWGRACVWFCARLRRERSTWIMAVLGLVGTAAIVTCWFVADVPRWSGLVTALIGLAMSGGMIWLVRLIGTAALGREAMGFGDVTLMAMIGAFLGWQASIITFFLAPFAGLLVGLVQLVLKRDQEIPYGPFLCLAALGVTANWGTIWIQVQHIFLLGPLIPIALGCCLMMMGVMLLAWRWFRVRVLGLE